MNAQRAPSITRYTELAQLVSTIDLLQHQVHRIFRQSDQQAIAGDHRETVRQIRRMRKARAKLIGSTDLFGEPAWDMLLALYALTLEQRRISVSGICLASGVPPTTALRWLEKLQDSGFVVREHDVLDARRVWVRLSDYGVSRMRAYFDTMANSLVETQQPKRVPSLQSKRRAPRLDLL